MNIDSKANNQVLVDNKATSIVRQAIIDYLASLPPAAKEAASLYFSTILNRTVVVANEDEKDG